MKLLVRFKDKFPILTGIIFTALFIGALIGVGKLMGLLSIPDLNTGGYTVQATAELIIALFCLIVLLLIKKGKTLLNKGFGKGLLCGMYLIVIAAINILMNASLGIAAGGKLRGIFMFFVFMFTMFLIGFAEEVGFRGIVASVIYDKYGKDYAGVWFSVIASGLIFGSVHLINGYTLGSYDGVFVQCLSAAAMGMLFSAVYYRSGSLWSVIFIHALIDFAALFGSVFQGDTSIADTIGSYSTLNIAAIVPYMLVVVFLLRPKKVMPLLNGEKSDEKSKIRLIIIATAAVMFLVITVAVTITNDITRLFSAFKNGDFDIYKQFMQ